MFVFKAGKRRRRRFAPRLHLAHALPEMPRRELLRHLRRLTRDEAALARRCRFVPLPGRGLWRPCVISDAASARAAREYGGVAVARVAPRVLAWALQEAFGEEAARRAAEELLSRSPGLSARYRLSRRQGVVLSLLAAALLTLLLWQPAALLAFCGAIAGLFYLLQASMQLSAPSQPEEHGRVQLLDDTALPVYSVLVPLYREARVLPQLLRALARLDYPAHKLDIKLLVEAVDEQTRTALAKRVLPAHVEVLTVPAGSPQTKPRALNYGLFFARGALVCVFDAEDVPHPGQLRVAASIFAASPSEVACLQAPLAWYNARQSFFTRMIAIDYAAHFAVILPFLAALGLPLPLGGTSNHFRTEALLAVGGWDPFNVTEDADLGLRLARAGWRTSVLPRVGTLEEACSTWRAWRHQRARWIKGWLQTVLVHQRAPGDFLRRCGIGGLYVLYAVLGAGVFAALLHPLFLLLAAWTLWQPAPAAWLGELGPWVSALSECVLVIGYAAAFVSAAAGLRRTRQHHLWPWLCLLPLYWLFISMAAWQALWDFVRRPHHWRKTAHGETLLLRG